MNLEKGGLILQNKKTKSMNEEFNEPNVEAEAEPTPEVKREYHTVSEALVAGREDGAGKAKEKAPELKSGIANVAHDVAYGLAYGTVFAGAFVNELIPSKIREGLSKGANAGRKAGKTACEKAADALNPEKDEAPAAIIS